MLTRLSARCLIGGHSFSSAIIISFLLFTASVGRSQNRINIDASRVSTNVISNEYQMGNPGPAGKEIKVNNLYLTFGGKPEIPVMGEMHYTRVPRDKWQDILLKMKANGINVISTYVFWIYHEEIEGQFDWSGNRDLRAFLKLCHKDSLYVLARIGPWSHGEVRNGGFPDWLLQKKYIHPRSNDPVYQHYVKQYFRQIGIQMKNLMYKDGGPVIGIQLENEYSGGKKGEKYISWLKKTAIADGMDAPLYVVTGWGNASVPKDEVIPLWGGYPGAPWNPNLSKIVNSASFKFVDLRSDGGIFQGSERKGYSVNTKIYPFFTVEMGVGNEVTYHRRPVFNGIDGLTIAMTRLGSGANMLGYYMFAGGSNHVGMLTSLQEDRKNTGYWNRYPIISYDFQAAIKESGELAPSYYQVKKLHYFLNEFGSQLAPMMPVIGPQKDPHEKLLYSTRVKGDSGFLFATNYYRGFRKPVQRNVQFNIRLKHERITFPQKPVDIPDSCDIIWPFNFRLNHVLMKYATAQPLCDIKDKNGTDWFFIQNRGIEPEFSFDNTTVSKISSDNGTITRKKNETIITGIQPGLNTVITLLDKQGKTDRLHILSSEQAKHLWLFKNNGHKYLLFSQANLYMDHDRLHLYGKSNNMKILVLAGSVSLSDQSGMIQPMQDGLYPEYQFTVPQKNVSLQLTPQPILSDAKWLKASVDQVTPKNQLWHKFFLKEFNLGNPSAITSAKMILDTQIQCRMKINDTWFNQPISTGEIDKLDITGYVKKGENRILLDFPFTKGDSSFAAAVNINYENSDKVTFSTDQSWLTYRSYTYPAPWTNIRNLQKPDTVAPKNITDPDIEPKIWTVTLPDDYMDGLNNLYLHVNYVGDRAQCRLHYRLIADNFNNGTPWHIGLKRFGDRLADQRLIFEVYPLHRGYKIYFDRKPKKEDLGKASLVNIRVIPEYAKDLQVTNH